MNFLDQELSTGRMGGLKPESPKDSLASEWLAREQILGQESESGIPRTCVPRKYFPIKLFLNRAPQGITPDPCRRGGGDVIQVLDSTAPLLDPVPQLVDCPLAIPFVVVALTGANHFPVGSLQPPAIPSGFTDLDDTFRSLRKDLKAGPGVDVIPYDRSHCFG